MSLLYELKLRRGRPSKLDSKLVGLTPAAREQLQRAAGKRGEATQYTVCSDGESIIHLATVCVFCLCPDQAIQALNSCQGVGNNFDDAINGISSCRP